MYIIIKMIYIVFVLVPSINMRTKRIIRSVLLFGFLIYYQLILVSGLALQEHSCLLTEEQENILPADKLPFVFKLDLKDYFRLNQTVKDMITTAISRTAVKSDQKRLHDLSSEFNDKYGLLQHKFLSLTLISDKQTENASDITGMVFEMGSNKTADYVSLPASGKHVYKHTEETNINKFLMFFS